MSLRSLEFAIGECFVNIRRNGLMSIASVTTVSLSLAVLGGFVLLALWLNCVATQLSREFQMSVFMKPNASPDEIAEARNSIRNMSHVHSLQHITAQEGWEQAKEHYKGYIDLRGVQNVALGDEFRIKLDDASYTDKVSSDIEQLRGVDEVVAARKEVRQVLRLAKLVKVVGIAASGVLLVITAFIIGNAIRLTLYARRREIRIMQLVGATNWFIRLPLLMEGSVLGALGGAVSCGLVLAGAYYVAEYVTKTWPLLQHYPSNVQPTPFFGGLVGLGCLIGTLGSLISIRRFLKA